MAITQERLKELVQYNEENGTLVRIKVTGRNTKIGQILGWASSAGEHLYCSIDGIDYPVAHMVWLYHFGYLPKELDHINRQSLDNKLSNLRECTQGQNRMNTKASVKNKLGIKGLRFNEQYQRYDAAVGLRGTKKQKCFYIRDYTTSSLAMQDAIRWLDDTRLTLHGNFACI